MTPTQQRTNNKIPTRPKQNTQKARCRECAWWCYNFLDGCYQKDKGSFCGLHGSAPVDPDGPQPTFLNRDEPGCGFASIYKQQSLF